ncbi:XPA protein C-terminus-domain-containing protein, partial [Pyronema omphalodes]
EENRLRAKAIRDARAREEKGSNPTGHSQTPPESSKDAGRKRPYSAIEPTSRKGGEGRENLRPMKKFTKYVEYDLSKMNDTKGGFMSTEDDPHSVLAAQNLADKPPGMTLEEWARHQKRMKLLKEKKGAFEPAISAAKDSNEDKTCFECKSPEIDFKWKDVFKCRVCEKCKKEKPDKYSLLTKTEAREDYLLTDPELKDEDLLPHLSQPNPHKSTWSNMMLYVKYQVEEFALKKWGSFEAMDAEFEKRTAQKKERNENKFKTRLRELKKRTRVDAWKREREQNNGPTKHEHVWGTAVAGEGGAVIKTCEDCGFELEEWII